MIAEREIKETIPLTVASKRIKYEGALSTGGCGQRTNYG